MFMVDLIKKKVKPSRFDLQFNPKSDRTKTLLTIIVMFLIPFGLTFSFIIFYFEFSMFIHPRVILLISQLLITFLLIHNTNFVLIIPNLKRDDFFIPLFIFQCPRSNVSYVETDFIYIRRVHS